jgi:hypothetical protein
LGVPAVGDHGGAERVGLDVAEGGLQVTVDLEDGALEPTLPHMANGAMPPREPPGMGDVEQLKEASDSDAGIGSEQEVELVRHQVIAIEPEEIAEMGPPKALEEGVAIGVGGEDDDLVVAAVDGIEGQAIVFGSR